MFGPEPSFIELTLAASLRDADAKRVSARVNAMHGLASATLREIGESGEHAWAAAERHARGEDILGALRRGLDDEDPQVRGLALLGLGRLGDRSAFELASTRLEDPAAGDDPPAIFERECALIALSHLGESAHGRAPDVHRRALEALREHLASPRDDVRFQAAPALARVGGRAEVQALREALRRETHPEVREHLVVGLGMLDADDDDTCAALVELLAEARGPEDVAGDPSLAAAAFEAARVLAGAGRADGLDELVRALRRTELRDDALEALAALPPRAVVAEALDPIRRLVGGWLTPPVTRVRAAYALARIAPSEGRPWLDRLEQHRRVIVREAVADARAALARLEARG